jgi:hypothetical protein
MDAFLTTVVAGVIVAVVGAILAFYFGRVQEQQQQNVERQREEQQQRREEQERRDQREKALNERRFEGLNGIRRRAYGAVNTLMIWTASGQVLFGDAPTFTDNLRKIMSEEPPGVASTLWDAAKDILSHSARAIKNSDSNPSPPSMDSRALLEEQGQQISKQIMDLSLYYREQTPYLEANSRNLFEEFEKELRDRHDLVMEALRRYNRAGAQLGSQSTSSEVAAAFLDSVKKLTTDSLEVLEAFEFCQAWNYQAHLDALDTEVERVASTLK